VSEVVGLLIPAMYADHHVQRVRQTLLALPGVEGVWASSAEMRVEVTYRADETDPSAIRAALEQAGYPEVPQPVMGTEPAGQAVAWHRSSVRPTQSNVADRQAAGDFRRY